MSEFKSQTLPIISFHLCSTDILVNSYYKQYALGFHLTLTTAHFPAEETIQ